MNLPNKDEIMRMGTEWTVWNGFGIYAKGDIHVTRIEDYLSKFRSIIMTACVCEYFCTHLKGAKDETSVTGRKECI